MQTKLPIIIAPSILNCDFSCLYDECQKLIDAGSDWLHVDIMDGHFVPNLTMGPPIIKCLSKKIKFNNKGNTFMDCHCMVSQPRKWIEQLAQAGANQMTVHYESELGDVLDISQKIRENGMKAGLALSPKTMLDETILNLLLDNPFDMVLIMTVEPGFGGQMFMPDMMPKVKQLREIYPNLNIQVDGGICCENVHIAAEAGANVIVSGTGIVNQDNQQKAISDLRNIVKAYNK